MANITIKIAHWYELWVDKSTPVPYVLFVCLNQSPAEEILIIDPKENNQLVITMPDYETAKLWLLEQEYMFVSGRMEIH